MELPFESVWPFAASGLLLIAAPAALVAWCGPKPAKAVTSAARIVGVVTNVPIVGLAVTIGIIGLAQGTDTSERENRLLAVSGFALAAIGITSSLALLESRRPIANVLAAAACVANGALLVIGIFFMTCAFDFDRIEMAGTMCGLGVINVSAISAWATYRLRFFRR